MSGASCISQIALNKHPFPSIPNLNNKSSTAWYNKNLQQMNFAIAMGKAGELRRTKGCVPKWVAPSTDVLAHARGLRRVVRNAKRC